MWMDILINVSNSQLILIRYSRSMEENLRNELEKHSLSPDKLVFWDPIPRNEHIYRCSVADVILDTVYGGAASSYDAIWTNTPPVTFSGNNVTNIIGASLLNYLGLNQLIATNLHEYRNIAISLGTDEDKYMDILRLLENSYLE